MKESSYWKRNLFVLLIQVWAVQLPQLNWRVMQTIDLLLILLLFAVIYLDGMFSSWLCHIMIFHPYWISMSYCMIFTNIFTIYLLTYTHTHTQTFSLTLFLSLILLLSLLYIVIVISFLLYLSLLSQIRWVCNTAI